MAAWQHFISKLMQIDEDNADVGSSIFKKYIFGSIIFLQFT